MLLLLVIDLVLLIIFISSKKAKNNNLKPESVNQLLFEAYLWERERETELIFKHLFALTQSNISSIFPLLKHYVFLKKNFFFLNLLKYGDDDYFSASLSQTYLYQFFSGIIFPCIWKVYITYAKKSNYLALKQFFPLFQNSVTTMCWDWINS